MFLILVTAVSCSTKYRNMQSFETVWQTVNAKHYDPTFGGVDWQALHNRYQPQIASAESDSEFFMLTNQMLFELNLVKRVVLVGDRSPGYLLGADWMKLSNGGSFMHTILQPLPADGKIIENLGVKPDIAVSLDRDALLEGRDTQLEAAIVYIGEVTKEKK